MDEKPAESASVIARETPAQTKLRENIATLNAQLAAMVHARSTGLDLQDPGAIKKKKDEITQIEKQLNRYASCVP